MKAKICQKDFVQCQRLQKLIFLKTNDEIQLLLQSVNQYKCKCEYDGINWESIRSKYERIQ